MRQLPKQAMFTPDFSSNGLESNHHDRDISNILSFVAFSQTLAKSNQSFKKQQT